MRISKQNDNLMRQLAESTEAAASDVLYFLLDPAVWGCLQGGLGVDHFLTWEEKGSSFWICH